VSAEVVYGVTDPDVTGRPDYGVAAKGDGHLAILRSDLGATKESEVAAGDIALVSGVQSGKTLAAASSDVLRTIIWELAQRMIGCRCRGAAQRGVTGRSRRTE
jgi:hypothetical protein